MTRIPPERLTTFREAIASGDRDGAVAALESQATSHAGTAPATQKRAVAKEIVKLVEGGALPEMALWFATHENNTAKEVGAILLAKTYAQHPREAIAALRRLAGDANWEVREWAGSAAATAFAEDFEAMYPVMEDWLRDESQFVRRAVCIALMGAADREKPERAEPLLTLADVLVRDEAEEVKRNAGPFALGSALLGHYPKQTLAHIRAWAKSDGEMERWNAAMVFVAANGAKHVEVGLEVLSSLAADKRRPVWMAVSAALRNLLKRAPQIEPELRSWLNDARKLPASLALRRITVPEQK
ncbi:MAG: DNA alkylation repair protein [Chloroflexota bacterium]